MKCVRWKEYGLDLLFDLAGSLLFGAGVNVFTLPNHIVPGGVTSLSTIFNYLFGVPVGLASFLINVPLLLVAWHFLGQRFTAKTLKSVLILSVVLDLSIVKQFGYTGDRLLAALFGGLLIGAGLALIFMRGSTTGGSDIVSRLFRLRFPHIQMGRALMLFDLAVVLLSALVFSELETALYGIVAIYASGRTIDAILYGLETGKMVWIVSGREAGLSREILHRLGRGVTVLEGKGAYSNQPRSVLLCAVRKSQFYELKKIVRTIDPAAFLIVSEAGEILGEGFKPNLPEDGGTI